MPILFLLNLIEVMALLGLAVYGMRLRQRLRFLDDHSNRVVGQLRDWVQEVEACNGTIITLLQEHTSHEADGNESVLPDLRGDLEGPGAMQPAPVEPAPAATTRTLRLAPVTPDQAHADTAVARQTGMDPIGVAIQRQLLARMGAARTS